MGKNLEDSNGSIAIFTSLLDFLLLYEPKVPPAHYCPPLIHLEFAVPMPHTTLTEPLHTQLNHIVVPRQATVALHRLVVSH